ncbi:hypothetical protein C0Q70_18297 [Pomacea canaliculata]|uniref:Uncharacterized protein n=1 Tax=Pomacea canaliculata TaxID=400727 RepID=A0A2T7NMV0_POMCA|nr:hypothetical protein C0Q70_18297 [Pomacea canaliculata]
MARSNESGVLTDIQTLLNKQEENIKHHIDEVRDELRLFKSAIDKLCMELQQVKQRQESLEQNTESLKDHVDQSLQVFDDKLDKLEGFSRRDNLKFFGIPETGEDSYETCAATIIQLLQETIPGKQQEERENPRTNADRSPSQHQTTLQQQTDKYTPTTAQQNKGVRQHRSSQSYLPLPLWNRYLPLQSEDEEEDTNRLQADKHGEQIDTNADTGRGATVENRHSKRIQCTPTTIAHALGNISNNLQMIPTAILPTKCPSESSITNTSTGDNTKGKDTTPYTSVTEANNSQTADVSSGCPPDSNVQVSSHTRHRVLG